MSKKTAVQVVSPPKGLTALEQVIIRLLASKPAPGLCGKDLVELSPESEKLKIGSIYVTLQRMQAKGLVDSKREDPGAMHAESVVVRRFYTPTELGLRLLAEQSQEAAR